MATGDDALEAGMDLVTGSEAANTIDTELNLTRDYIAQRTKRNSANIDIIVQASAPGHREGRIWIKRSA